MTTKTLGQQYAEAQEGVARINRLRDAAPELVNALRDVTEGLEAVLRDTDGYPFTATRDALTSARALLASIDGKE